MSSLQRSAGRWASMLSSISLSRSLPAFTLSLSMKEAGPTSTGTGRGNDDPEPRPGLLSAGRMSGSDSIVLSNVFDTTSTIGFSENVDGGNGWGSWNADGGEETENEVNVGLSSTLIPELGPMFWENSGWGKLGEKFVSGIFCENWVWGAFCVNIGSRKFWENWDDEENSVWGRPKFEENEFWGTLWENGTRGGGGGWLITGLGLGGVLNVAGLAGGLGLEDVEEVVGENVLSRMERMPDLMLLSWLKRLNVWHSEPWGINITSTRDRVTNCRNCILAVISPSKPLILSVRKKFDLSFWWACV